MSGTLSWERDGKDWPNRSASQFVEASGLRWHVQIQGEGPALLLLHGTGASTHSWSALFPRLAERYTVIAPDLPGHGFTQAPPNERLSLPGMALAVQSLLTRFSLKPEIMIGHSAGAAIAIQMALKMKPQPCPVIGLNAALMPFRGLSGQLFPMMAKLLVLNPFVPRFFAWRASDRESVRQLINGTGSKIDDVSIDFYRRLFSTRSHVSSTLAMMAQWSLEDLVRDMPKLSAPLLLIVGENDKAVPPSDAQKIRRMLPQTAIATVTKAGHLCHEERPEAVLKLIFDWIGKHHSGEVDQAEQKRRSNQK
jgi:magnesium chelatase accessory protein